MAECDQCGRTKLDGGWDEDENDLCLDSEETDCYGVKWRTKALGTLDLMRQMREQSERRRQNSIKAFADVPGFTDEDDPSFDGIANEIKSLRTRNAILVSELSGSSERHRMWLDAARFGLELAESNANTARVGEELALALDSIVAMTEDRDEARATIATLTAELAEARGDLDHVRQSLELPEGSSSDAVLGRAIRTMRWLRQARRAARAWKLAARRWRMRAKLARMALNCAESSVALAELRERFELDAPELDPATPQSAINADLGAAGVDAGEMAARGREVATAATEVEEINKRVRDGGDLPTSHGGLCECGQLRPCWCGWFCRFCCGDLMRQADQIVCATRRCQEKK